MKLGADEITTEEAGLGFLLAYRRLRASHAGDAEALREYADASDMLLATFADSMGNISHAAAACGSYCSALVHCTENIKRPHAKVVARA